MTLAQKLAVYALAVAMVPLALTGFWLIRVSEEALYGRIVLQQQTASSALAVGTAEAIRHLGERVGTVLGAVDVQALNAEEQAGLLRLLLAQSPDFAAARLELDGREVSAVGEPAALAALQKISPDPRTSGASLGPAYFPGDGRGHVTLVVSGTHGARVSLDLVISAGLVALDRFPLGAEARAFVVDAFGRVVSHPTLAAGTALASHAAVATFMAGGASGSAVAASDGTSWLTAFAQAPGLGLAVVVEQATEIAFEPVRLMRRRILLAFLGTATLVLTSAFLFAARLRTRLRALLAGARAFAARRLDERVALTSADEVSELASTLNDMAGALQKALGDLEAWNRTLEEKVDERTRQLKESQAQQVVQAKLAALGQLGAGVAHEVNNPLAGILGYAQLLLRKRGPDDADAATLKKIEEAAQRCKVVTTGLLRFSQQSLLGRAPVNLSAVVGEVLDLVGGALAEHGIAITRDLGALPTIEADAGQVAIVVTNVISNARNAMPDGGRLSVATAQDAGGVRLVVRDSGHGIAAEHLPRIFDPFFTTKNAWTGAGLGLSVAYRVVADHGGRIVIESEIGVGTQVTIVLPEKADAAIGTNETLRRAVTLA